MFDPVSPDRRWYMDLLVHEQWGVATIMVKFAIVEPGENWVYEHYWVLDRREIWHLNQDGNYQCHGQQKFHKIQRTKTSFNVFEYRCWMCTSMGRKVKNEKIIFISA